MKNSRRNIIKAAGLIGIGSFTNSLHAQEKQITSGCDSCCVYVEDFGAIGDGVSDDSSSIQKAINEAALCGKPLLFRSKTYIIKKELEASVKVLNTQGIEVLISPQLIGAPIFGNTRGTALVAGSPNMISIMVARSDVRIKNILFDGAYNAKSAFRLRGCSNSLFEECTFQYASKHGCWLQKPKDIDSIPMTTFHNNDNNEFRNCNFINNGILYSSENVPNEMKRSIGYFQLKGVYISVEENSNIVHFIGPADLNSLGLEKGDAIQIGFQNHGSAMLNQHSIAAILGPTSLKLSKPYKGAVSKSLVFCIGTGCGYYESGHSDNNTNDLYGGKVGNNASYGAKFSSPYGPVIQGVQFDEQKFSAIFLGDIDAEGNNPAAMQHVNIIGNYFGDSAWEAPICLAGAISGINVSSNVGLFNYPNDLNQPPILYADEYSRHSSVGIVQGSKFYSVNRVLIYTPKGINPGGETEIFSRGLINGRLVGTLQTGESTILNWDPNKSIEVDNFHIIISSGITKDTAINVEIPFLTRAKTWENLSEYQTEVWVRITNGTDHKITLLDSKSNGNVTGLSLNTSQLILDPGESILLMQIRGGLWVQTANAGTSKGQLLKAKQYRTNSELPNVGQGWQSNQFSHVRNNSGTLAFVDDSSSLWLFNGSQWKQLAQNGNGININTSYEIKNENFIFVDASKGTIVITTPDVKDIECGFKFSVIKNDSSSQIVEVRSAQLINGNMNGIRVNVQYKPVHFVSDGKNWIAY